MKKGYFAASNSAGGFKSYYAEIFKGADFMYVIKGGPGTGKSSFMKKCAAYAENIGAECEYYYCSSDPESLDGVLISAADRKIAILDGTAPHVCEPNFPGARDEIINFSQFWNTSLLYKQRNEVISLSERKSSEYKNAYTFLRSVGNLRAVNDSLIRATLDHNKMNASIARILRELDSADKSEESVIIPAITDSVSMRGRVRFDTFEHLSDNLYRISDAYGAGEIYLDAVLDQLRKKRVRARVSYDPVCSDHADGIFIEDTKTAFVLGSASEDLSDDNDGNSVINMRRFIDGRTLREVRSEIRYTAHLAQSSLDGALHALSKAKIYHFLLEDIYGGAMDWGRFAEMKIEDMFSF